MCDTVVGFKTPKEGPILDVWVGVDLIKKARRRRRSNAKPIEGVQQGPKPIVPFVVGRADV